MSELTFDTLFRVVKQRRVITVTCANWDGVVECVPRAHLAAYVNEVHAGRIGTYITTGIDERTGRPFAYVGSGVIAERLCKHLRDAEKGAFSRVVIIYTTSGWLTRDRAGHLESCLYHLMRDLGQARVQNGLPPSRTLPDGDPDLGPMSFFKQLTVEAICHIGLGMLVESMPRLFTAPPPCGCGTGEETFRLATNQSGLDAQLVVRGDRLYLRAGSLTRAVPSENWAERRGTGFVRREEMIADGRLLALDDGRRLIASRDIFVRSPSEASCIVATQEKSGLPDWRHVPTDRCIGDLYAGKEWLREE